jgi:hypothetical protein
MHDSEANNHGTKGARFVKMIKTPENLYETCTIYVALNQLIAFIGQGNSLVEEEQLISQEGNDLLTAVQEILMLLKQSREDSE